MLSQHIFLSEQATDRLIMQLFLGRGCASMCVCQSDCAWTPVKAFCLFCSVEFMQCFLGERDRQRNCPSSHLLPISFSFVFAPSASSFCSILGYLSYSLFSSLLAYCCSACLLPRATSDTTVQTFCPELTILWRKLPFSDDLLWF